MYQATALTAAALIADVGEDAARHACWSWNGLVTLWNPGVPSHIMTPCDGCIPVYAACIVCMHKEGLTTSRLPSPRTTPELRLLCRFAP